MPDTAYEYIRDGAEIYRRSFAMIRSESDLTALPADAEGVVVRMIHACGQTDLPRDVRISAGAVTAARAALMNGAPILCDVNMIASGVTRSRLPKDNDVICLLNDPRTAALASRLATTRTAAAVQLWRPMLAGSVVAIGNAPTALYALLELIDSGAEPPAVVVGAPVGFVGAAESSEALSERTDLEYITVLGRRGGSAITVAAVNALASPAE